MTPRRSTGGAATTFIAALLILCGALLVPSSSEAQGLGRILGGAVGGSVLRSATAIGSDRRFVIVQPRLAIAEARRAGSVTRLALDRDRNLLLVVLADGSARWWDIDRGIERGAVRNQRIVAGLIRGGGLSADILAVRADGSSALLRLDGSPYPLSERIVDFDRAAQFAAVAESGAIAFRRRDGTWWLNTGGGERFGLPDAAADALPVFSADGYTMAYLADRGRAARVMRLGGRGPEPAGLLPSCSRSTRITAARFTPAGGRIVLGDARGNLCLWDVSGASAPRLLFSVPTGLSGPVRTLALDREGRLAAAGNGGNAVEIWPIAGRIERASYLTLQMGSAAALALDTDRGWLFAGGGNGSVAIHDIGARDSERRSRPIASLISTKDGWSVLDSAGRFDGSQNGIDALSWAGEAQEGGSAHELPVDSFSESHYEPGLLAKLDGPASGLLNDTAADIPGSGYVRPPDVSIEIGNQDAAGRLPVTVRTESGYPADGVAGLRLYHNGKLILEGEGNATLQTVVRLMPGENRIGAVAVGPDGIEGRTATRTATLAAPQLPADLNVLAIGINDYAKPAWELFFPRNDAETLVSALRDRGTRLLAENGRPAFTSVRAETLLDRSASKDAIESLIERTETGAQDVLVLYFAGHGYALEDERGWDWYLLPYTRQWRRSTASPEEAEDLIREHGLSARHLMSLLTRTPAQRVFLVLDSCHSGAVVEAVEGMVAPSPRPGDDAATQKALRQIARIGGLHVLAASRAHEKATELQLEPHGALTYLVLEGVRGEADTDGDSSVTVREVIDYATAEMPNLADRLSQQPISQKPLGYSRGADFAVVGSRPMER